MKRSIACLGFLVASIAINAQSGYHLVKTFHIASPGGWDYPASDPNSNKLYLSHGGQVNIIDKTTGDSLGYIPGTTGVHGIAFASGKGYTSNGRLNNVTVFDLATGKELGHVAAGTNPDWIMYDAFSKKIVTSNHTGGDLSLIDPATDRVTKTIPVGGKLETVVSDGEGKLFVNVEDKNEIAEVDIAKGMVMHRWSLAPADGPTGLAIDTKTKRLFTTCDKLLVIVDITNGKIVDKLPIGDGTDGAAFDPSSGLIFTANGEGTVTVIKEESKDKFRVVETIKTKKGARTITIDEKTHKLFLPTADYEPVPAGSPANTRPKMIPGSFQVLVLEK